MKHRMITIASITGSEYAIIMAKIHMQLSNHNAGSMNSIFMHARIQVRGSFLQ